MPNDTSVTFDWIKFNRISQGGQGQRSENVIVFKIGQGNYRYVKDFLLVKEIKEFWPEIEKISRNLIHIS